MANTAYRKKARDYSAYRPQYPVEAMEALCESIGLDASWIVADIGSGTGNVARHFVKRVARVFCVEPDDAMRRESERLLAGHPVFTAIAATAESTTLPDASVDLITVGQAIHWFDIPRARLEFSRILKPGGFIAFIWNRFGEQDEPDMSAFLVRKTTTRLSFPSTIRENWTQFIGGARSAAYAPDKEDPQYAEFERQQKAAFDARSTNGLITVEFCTELAAGRLESGIKP